MSYLLSIGPDAAPLVAEHLARAAAPLARELLAALGKLAPPSPPVEAGPYLTHFDPTLRREAAKLLLGYESDARGDAPDRACATRTSASCTAACSLRRRAAPPKRRR